jgi:hypothetical protein
MRRLTPHDDRGVATILVVLMMPLLVLFGALVFDGGRILLARGQAQNAADAGAVAKALDCAAGRQTTNLAPYQTNGATFAKPTSRGSATTTVTMARNVAPSFVLRSSDWIVTRSATASWGSLGTAATLPLTIANCEFAAALLDGTTDITVYLDDAQPQSGCVSLPGGFSQLAGDDCEVEVSAAGNAAGKTGADLQKVVPCLSWTGSATSRDVLIPMYDADACLAAVCKGTGPYQIVGFAMFRVTGYSFNGNTYAGTLPKRCPDDRTRGTYCIRGDFIRFATSAGSPGPSDSRFGVFQVSLAS